jgi:hypothetical protein
MNPHKPAVEFGQIVTDGKLIGEWSACDRPGPKFLAAGFYINVILPIPELRNVAINAFNALAATPQTKEPLAHKLRRLANILNTAADEIDEIEAAHGPAR